MAKAPRKVSFFMLRDGDLFCGYGDEIGNDTSPMWRTFRKEGPESAVQLNEDGTDGMNLSMDMRERVTLPEEA